MCAQRSWNDEERQQVAGLLKSGRSLGKISRLMGVTRATAVGRIYRDGALHVFVGAAVIIEKEQAVDNTVQNVVEDEPEPEPEVVVGKLLFQLATGDCRWPTGEHETLIGGFVFCGEPKLDGSPYCAKHHRTAYSGLRYTGRRAS